jgi:hypothetical protein
VALSSGTVLFFENFYGRLAFEGCARVNGLSGHGRFFAAQASVHVLMFGASLANGFATGRGTMAQSGCLSFGSLLAIELRQSAIRHFTGGLSVLKAASSSWHHAINIQGTAQKYARRHRQSKAANGARPVLRQPSGKSVLRQVDGAWQNLSKQYSSACHGRESVMQRSNISHGFEVRVFSTPSPACTSLTVGSTRTSMLRIAAG